MTEESTAIDLDAAKEGVKNLYAEPKSKVLDPEAMDKSLLGTNAQPYRLENVNPPIPRQRNNRRRYYCPYQSS